MNVFERRLGFKVDWVKLIVLLVVVVGVIAFVFGKIAPGISGVVGQTQEDRFLERVEEGDIQPVETQEILITAEGIEPKYSLIRLNAQGTPQVVIKNVDSRTRTIVVDNRARTMPPDYFFTLTFGQGTEMEIYDQEDPSVRGKIFVRG